MELMEFGDRLVALLPKLMQEITRHENNYVTSGKITCQQFLVLEALSHHKEWRMNELVAAMKTSFSTATEMVDRLAKQGLAKRYRGAEDRRTVLVLITPKGQRIINEICVQKKEGIVRLFERLTAQERRQYLEIIEKLVLNFSRVKEK